METKDLKCFSLVAETENINLASKAAGVPKGTMSKAIKRLEDELAVQLFERVGRGLKITQEGFFLKEKAFSILALEENTRLTLKGSNECIIIKIGYDQQLISIPAMKTVGKLSEIYTGAKIHLLHQPEKLKEKILSGEIGIGFTGVKPSRKLFKVSKVGSYELQTIVRKKHPLLKKGKKVSINDVLKFKFVTADFPLVDKIHESMSQDGWRDDKYKRDISFYVSDIKHIEALVLESNSVAYVPEYIAQSGQFEVLEIFDCDNQCFQDLFMFTKKDPLYGWINQIF